MSDPAPTAATHSSSTAARENAADFCAVLVLDAAGRVCSANASARTLWQTGDTELIGDAFPSLFVFEVFSTDPEFVQAQWDVLLGSALERMTRLTAQPREGAPREVHVRIEPQLGAAGYIATVQPAAIALPPANSTALPEGAASFQLLTGQGALGFFELNLAEGRVHLSPSWKRLLGYTPEELPDTLATWHSLIHPDDTGAAPDKLRKKPGVGPRPFNAEFRMKHQLGRWVWVQCAGVQVISPARELERVVGIHFDITDRKELEDALVANDVRLQDLSGSGPLAAFELDFAHNVFWFSPAFETLLGYAEGELAPGSHSFAATLPADEAPDGAEAWLLARAPGQNTFVETVRLRAKDGSSVPVLLGAHRSVKRKRELVRVVGFACPLPAGALTEPAALSPLLAEAAFSTLAEAVLIADVRGKIVFANSAAARLLHSDHLTLRDQAVGDVFRLVDRRSLHAGSDPIDRALSADQPLSLISDDALAAHADHPAQPIVWTARVARGGDGTAQGVVIVFRNPEEMTLTPEELVKSNRFEALGLLAGGIAHDFNNLLSTILGAVSLAKDNRDHSALVDAENACLTAKGLTKQLLATAKGGAGTRTVCEARALLEDSIKLAAAGSAADVTLQISDDTEPIHVDRGQILQVFQNLIINALQAMPPSPHRARLQIRAHNVALHDNHIPALAAGDYVEFEVRDNGTGIKPEHVEKIFDPFFTTKKHGTGLGLATVLSIVRKHGGQIGLDTQLGIGTAFTVYLPKADKPLEVQARRAAELRFGTGRILFMDDDPNITALTARMLESLDYKYDLAKDGEEAIALYKRYLNIGRPYDAVIMDLTIIGAMGGEECFAELRKLDPDVRAIVSSGYDNDDMARQFLAKGFCGYLSKPYRVTDLGKALKTVLG